MKSINEPINCTSSKLDAYTEFIENALQMREESITKERQLIGQSSYLLNGSGSKWLNIGLSPEAGFVPIIQLRSSNACIFFTEDERHEFMKSEGSSCNHQIEASTYKNIKSRKQQIVLSAKTYKNLFNLQVLIKHKLNL